MKANELMIDDWVMVKHTHREPSAERIEGVGRDVVLIKTESGMQSFGYDKVSPIPLTPELLKKNGFWFGHTVQEEDFLLSIGVPVRFDQRWCFDDGDGEITVSFPKEIYLHGTVAIDNQENMSMELKFEETIYVHELQHTLRLCGLGELADNFKVK